MKRLDAGMPVYEMKTLQGQLDETLLSDRLIAMLSAGLRPARDAAGLDRPLRRDGVHRRAPPQGARHPAGAWRRAAGVVWLVMKEVLLLLVIGLAVGIPAAIALGRYVSSQLYGIQPGDPWIAIATVVLLSVVSAAAGMIPAHRASRIDPILALRYE